MSKVLKSSIGHRLVSSFRSVFSFVFSLQNFLFKIQRIERNKLKGKKEIKNLHFVRSLINIYRYDKDKDVKPG